MNDLALVSVTIWATIATGIAVLSWVALRKSMARIGTLELEVAKLRNMPCTAPCAALLQRDGLVEDARLTMRSLARRIEKLEDALGKTLDRGMAEIINEITPSGGVDPATGKG